MKGNLKRPDFRELMNPCCAQQPEFSFFPGFSIVRCLLSFSLFSREFFISGSVSENRGRKNDGN